MQADAIRHSPELATVLHFLGVFWSHLDLTDEAGRPLSLNMDMLVDALVRSPGPGLLAALHTVSPHLNF